MKSSQKKYVSVKRWSLDYSNPTWHWVWHQWGNDIGPSPLWEPGLGKFFIFIFWRTLGKLTSTHAWENSNLTFYISLFIHFIKKNKKSLLFWEILVHTSYYTHNFSAFQMWVGCV